MNSSLATSHVSKRPESKRYCGGVEGDESYEMEVPVPNQSLNRTKDSHEISPHRRMGDGLLAPPIPSCDVSFIIGGQQPTDLRSPLLHGTGGGKPDTSLCMLINELGNVDQLREHLVKDGRRFDSDEESISPGETKPDRREVKISSQVREEAQQFKINRGSFCRNDFLESESDKSNGEEPSQEGSITAGKRD
jgi:hypothetical protein